VEEGEGLEQVEGITQQAAARVATQAAEHGVRKHQTGSAARTCCPTVLKCVEVGMPRM
jgi:hypothetical protein